MISSLRDNLKSMFSWHTNRKIIVFSIDDYGNVRLDSKRARQNMDKLGIKAISRFDAFDSMETREDLVMLFEVLTSVKDKYNKHAVFTPFALPCNIDFEMMEAEGYNKYHYELLPITFKKLSERNPKSYEGTWDLWKEGIAKGIMKPQFHGREHFNLKIFEEKLSKKDKEIMTTLSNRSYTDISSTGYETIGFTSAFEFWEFEENKRFESIIKEGLDAFENVFGYRSTHFNSPGAGEHPYIHNVLKENGIKYLDTPWIKKTHQGLKKYKTSINYTGNDNSLGMIYQVRNVVFEPTYENGVDWVSNAFKQVETAFRWNAPAIITSHRVNYCGNIDTENRKKGLLALKELLKKIVKKWPEVEFMDANELGDLISLSKTI